MILHFHLPLFIDINTATELQKLFWSEVDSDQTKTEKNLSKLFLLFSLSESTFKSTGSALLSIVLTKWWLQSKKHGVELMIIFKAEGGLLAKPHRDMYKGLCCSTYPEMILKDCE